MTTSHSDVLWIQWYSFLLAASDGMVFPHRSSGFIPSEVGDRPRGRKPWPRLNARFPPVILYLRGSQCKGGMTSDQNSGRRSCCNCDVVPDERAPSENHIRSPVSGPPACGPTVLSAHRVRYHDRLAQRHGSSRGRMSVPLRICEVLVI
jgi:hypothetical protein